MHFSPWNNSWFTWLAQLWSDSENRVWRLILYQSKCNQFFFSQFQTWHSSVGKYIAALFKIHHDPLAHTCTPFLQRTHQRFEEWADALVKHGWRQSGKPRSQSLGCSTRPGGGTVSGYAVPEEWAQSLFYQSISVLLPFWDTLIADVFVLFLSFRSPLPSLDL